MTESNPYDELPYLSFPIEETAPERLALASLIHGGPRPPICAHDPHQGYRVLELGCGTGANLLPLAHFRRHATFVGVDASARAIATATARKDLLGLPNVEFIRADLVTVGDELDGGFDYIISHGVVSWVRDDVRDALLAHCARHLNPGGLVYISYNARPGWDVRGLVREFLLRQTLGLTSLRARAERAQELSAKVAASLHAAADHPYIRLMEGEFRLVGANGPAYVAHEYLAPDNHAYWRSEFLDLARRHGLEYVADADFNRDSGRTPDGLPELIIAAGLVAAPLDTVDLLSYRQFHSPIFTVGPFASQPPRADELGDLFVASRLTPLPPPQDPGPRLFKHASGVEVGAREPVMWTALERLRPLWPRGIRARELFPDTEVVADDLRWLQRNGFIELRLIEPGDFAVAAGPLNDQERRWGGYTTTAYHTRENVSAESSATPP